MPDRSRRAARTLITGHRVLVADRGGVVDWVALAEPHRSPDLATLAAAFVDPAEDRAVKCGYLRWFTGGGDLLDVGCGPGAFLDVARAAGRAAAGIDASRAAVEACAARGHTVVRADAAEHLEAHAAAGERLGGILLAHVVEHLQPAGALRVLRAAASALAPGARIVVVTPNLRSAIQLEEVFWLDPTHVRPYPRALLEKLCGAAGLEVVASYDDPATRPRRSAWRRAVAWLRSVASGVDRSGPMDSVVVAERAAV